MVCAKEKGTTRKKVAVMKLGILALASLASLASLVLVAGCAAEQEEDIAGSSQDLVSATSAYTESGRAESLDACRLTRDFDAASGRPARWDCGEMGGYTLVASQGGEMGQLPLVRTPNGTFSLDIATGSPAFAPIDVRHGHFAKLAEWRGRGLVSATAAAPYSGRVEPSALIMRYFHPASPGADFQGANTLLVVKLAPEGACVFGSVSGATPNHNQRARDLADSEGFRDFVCPVQTPEPLAPSGCGVLASNTGLAHDTAVSSCSGSHTLVMQSDDNLVLYNNRTGRATWSSRTVGAQIEAAIMRPSGQLGLYAAGMTPVFETPTAGNAGATLAVQDDGNVVVYSANGRALWATGTQGR